MPALFGPAQADCSTSIINENGITREPRTRTKYKYDSDTSCSGSNSFPGLLVSKTDARGIRSCAQYDALNRETVHNYSNGDATITTTYDQSACLVLAACQNVGHATSNTDGAGSESWAYQVDPANLRSAHSNQRTTTSSPSNITKTSTYYFDLASNLTSITYPTGRIVNYTYDAANRPATAVDSANGITYASAQVTPPSGCLATGVCYTPQGARIQRCHRKNHYLQRRQSLGNLQLPSPALGNQSVLLGWQRFRHHLQFC